MNQRSYPKTMVAAVLTQLGQPLEMISGIEIPEPSQGQVLVQIAYSGVCQSQLMEARGHRGADPWLPHLLGHEGSGRVVAVGPGVSKVRPGDLVVLTWIRGTGMDARGAVYKKGDLKINSGAVTTFNEYAIVAENRCVKLPEGLPLDIAVLFGCAIPTGAGIPLHELDIKEGASVALIGMGGIGLSALVALKLFKCSQIIAVDVEPAKLELARELGATDFVNANDPKLADTILSLTGGQGVDFAIEAAGMTRTIEIAFEILKKKSGVCVFASHPPEGEKIRLAPHELISGKRIWGTWGGNCQPDSDVPKLAALYLDGSLPFGKLISKRYAFGSVNEALADLEKRKINRAVLEINPDLKS